MENSFSDFETTSSGRRAKTMLEDHAVKPQQVFATVLAEVTQALPYLEESGRYTTEMLCGPDIWANWLTAESRVAGMCLVYMVRRRMVELFRHRTPSGGGKAKFRTTPSPVPVRRPIKIVRNRRTGTGHNNSAGSMTCL